MSNTLLDFFTNKSVIIKIISALFIAVPTIATMVKKLCKNTWKNLSKHEVFAILHQWQNEDLYPADIKDDTKRYVIKKIIDYKLRRWKELLCDGLDKKGVYPYGCILDNKDAHAQWVYNHMSSVQKELIEKGVPDIYLSKFSEKYNKAIVGTTHTAIERLIDDPNVTKPVHRYSMVLTIYGNSIAVMRELMITTANDLNGELNKFLREFDIKVLTNVS